MTDVARLAARVWYGDDVAAALARAALAPASLIYGAVVRARGALYDAGTLAAHPLALPALSVGNVTVGGTGKTPVAAWLAARLREQGATPAIVLRGYGDDEPRVHARLVPGMPVIVDADRVRGVAAAAARGADVAVLDDAFQHRRARRDADVVLASAEHAERPPRLLPAGPYREPPSALRRASLIVVTRKSVSPDVAQRAAAMLSRIAENVPIATVALSLDTLHAWHDESVSATLAALRGARVLAIAAVGEPAAFFAQLRAAGARVDEAAFADHHAFDAADAERLARRADGVDRVVCTLKDAVKLGPLWPRLASPLWYVSQRVVVETGGDALDLLLARLLDSRAHRIAPPGSGRTS